MSNAIIAIAGNPNSGKSSIFNLLTGGRQKVGNWPGVTIDKKIGKIGYTNFNADLVDLPGIYALNAWSEDERIARDYLMSSEADLLINVVDSTNLERNLFLTYLLKNSIAESKVPMIVVLNMIDIAEKQGIKIDVEGIEKELGVPVIAASAVRKGDRKRILDIALKSYEDAKKTTEKTTKKLALPPQDPAEYETLAENTYSQIEGIIKRCVKKGIKVYTTSDKIDKVVTNKYIGFPIFLIAMYLLFWLTINAGGIFIDFFDIAFGAIFVDGFRLLLEHIGSPDALTTILADGLGAGIQTLSTFFPVIFTLFFFISFLESSGYMARAAFVMDRLMRVIGLPGRAFIPMLIGFGCAVPAFMATRSLENKRDRILSVFMIPFMSCGARLPVYVLFAAAFFPDSGTNMVFALYLIGIVLAIITGLLLKRTVYKGSIAPFVMELPQYHSPSVKNAAINASFRLKAFVRKAGRVLVPIIAVLGILNSIGTDGSFGNKNGEPSLLEAAGKGISPVFEPMGVDKDNWAASVSLFSGLFAKEVIIGSLNSLYSQNAQNDNSQNDNAEGDSNSAEEEEFNLGGSLVEALKTIPENVLAFGARLTDPLAMEDASEGADETLFNNMRSAFHNSKAAAFAFLIFVLLYVPCISAVSAATKEVGGALVILHSLYSTVLAWCLSTLFYQCFEGGSAKSIAFAIGTLIVFVVGILIYARKSGRFE
ncbi:ferrous iron transport protein B [Fibrobacterales bacterium]|nr:ferrous iron transport protein B [Fibrobacterales bacterium]